MTKQIACTGCGGVHPRPRKDGTIPELRLKLDGTPAVPRGWLARGNDLLCGACRGAGWRMRAVSFPTAPRGEFDANEWRNQLREAWRQAALIGTKTERLLYTRDASVDGKPGPMPKVSDTEVRESLPGYCPSGAATQIKQAVTTRYAKRRRAILVDHSDTVSVYKDPSPFVVRGSVVKIVEGGDGRLYVDFPWVTGERIQLELLGGRDFRRQHDAVNRVLSGDSRLGCVAVVPQMARGGGEGIRVGYRRTGRAMNDVYRPMVKVVLEEPRARNVERVGVARLVTGGRPLLALLGDGLPSKGFVWNGDHLRCILVRRERAQLALREDRKAVTGASRQACSDRMTRVSEKSDRRMDAAIKLIAAQVADKCRRCGIGRVCLEDKDRSFHGTFPWTKLRASLENALHDVDFVVSDGDEKQ